MKKIISEKLISKTNKIKRITDLFNEIATLVANAGLTNNKQELVNDLEAREKEGSTAFENGLVIPHCRTNAVKNTTLAIVNFNDTQLKSIDNKPSNFAVAILVPKVFANEHLKILSQLSTLFSTKEKLEKFRSLSKKQMLKKINAKIKINYKNKEFLNKKVKKYDFVGVTSCAAGIAHTYMARDALVDAGNELNLKAKIETQGSITENKLTREDIKNARFVVIASDVTVSKTPFIGKRLTFVHTNDAIKNAKKVILSAKNAPFYLSRGKPRNTKDNIVNTTGNKKEKILGRAVMSALSYMIPIAIAGGILMAIPNALAAGGNQSGGTWKFPNPFVHALWSFGHLGLILMVPIFAMFLAYKIGGKPAMPAALLGAYFINDGSLMSQFSIIALPKQLGGNASAGFLGGIVVGLFVGYLVKYMQWIKWHKWVKPVANFMVVPIISSFLTFLIVVYVVGAPMTWVMAELYRGLNTINAQGIWLSILVGILFATLIAVDMGGPVNKTALIVATLIFLNTLNTRSPNFVPFTAVQAAISVAPLGMWLSTVIFKKRFSKQEIIAGEAALPMGLVGITEGALPFAFRTPLRTITANICGSAVAGALVTVFNIHFYGGLGSPLGAYIGFLQNSYFGLFWIASVFAGVLVTGMVYGLLRKKVPAYAKEVELAKKAKRLALASVGVNTKKSYAKHVCKKFVLNFGSNLKRMINPVNWVERPNNTAEEDSFFS